MHFSSLDGNMENDIFISQAKKKVKPVQWNPIGNIKSAKSEHLRSPDRYYMSVLGRKPVRKVTHGLNL